MPVLHVVVPIFNEEATLEPCLGRVVAAPLPDGWTRALVLVDDHSKPDAYVAVERIATTLQEAGVPVALLRHPANRGKGAAIRSGFHAILDSDVDPADLVIVQDADLEYDPCDYARLMSPVTEGRAAVSIGTRFGTHAATPGVTRRIHAWGNRVLTRLSNIMTGFALSDMECCYKLMTVDVLRRLAPLLTEERFGIEPQLVAGLARLGVKVTEVPVAYEPRGFKAGKKIGWRDGIRALYVITRERIKGRPAGRGAPA